MWYLAVAFVFALAGFIAGMLLKDRVGNFIGGILK